MADTLVERVTGLSSAEQPVEVQLIITDRSLFGGGDEPAQVPGYGPIPADLARRWILSLLDSDGDDEAGDGRPTGDAAARLRRFDRGRVWLRRLYTGPDGRDLVAMESTRRSFPRLLRRLIEYRDRLCATPYCGAPVRHIDHTVPHRDGGPTGYTNGRGVCAACNHAKEAPGWTASVTDTTVEDSANGPPERIVTLTTPTGHSYRSSPPPAHVAGSWADVGQPVPTASGPPGLAKGRAG